MSPKIGRPKTENPINIRISIRLDAETDRKLIAYCRQNGFTKAEAIRKGILLLLETQK